MYKLVSSVVLALMFFSYIGNANAHTIAVGYANSGQGSVTFWYKSWHEFDEPFFEGSFNLVGTNGNPFPSTTVDFDQSFGGNGQRPPGLVDGVNLFYGCSSGDAQTPPVLCPTDEDDEGGDKWQGVTFNNLQVGEYIFSYIPIDNPSVDWEPEYVTLLTGTLNLDSSIISGGSTAIPTLTPVHLLLLVLGLVGVAATVRRKLS